MRIIRNLFVSAVIMLTFAVCAMAQNVNVTASGGTPAATYPTLGAAFSAVNAGTHTGTITIDIIANTTETAAAVLNSSGAIPASYTSILIRPTVDGVTIAGPTVTGRGLIELNGADNVTIDGDNPNSAGTNRNLTITNTAANTVTFTSVIRIALAATVVTSSDNVSLRNLNLNGSATGRNVTGANSATGTENTTYGVLATGGASTASATTAPSAITSVATTIGTGATANNLTISNNNVQTAARGVAVQGSSTTVFPGLMITNNLIGNSTAAAVNQVYSVGITAQGSANGSVAGNTVYVEGFVASSTSAANRAIDIGGISAVGTFIVERNMVNRVMSNAPDFWVAHGINIGGGTANVVRNNFVSNVTVNTTSGGFYSTTFNAAGIRVASGLNHQIYHNSVNMNTVIPGATPTISAAFLITANTLTGIDVRNNIFVNTQTGGGATSALVSVYLPSGATSAMNLTLNNNDYWNGAAPGATNGVGQVGTTVGTGFYTQANFDPTLTTPAANFRSYTSTLSAAGTNDNASKKVDPQFVSATDLHIAPASPMVDMGASVGVTTDIDGQSRTAIPDIGADEPGGITPPANDIAATVIVTPANGSTFGTGATVTPQASFQNVGTAAQTNVMVQFTITGPGGYSYSNTQTIASINPNQTVTVTFAATPAFTTAGTYNMSAAVTTADANSANDTVSGTFTVLNPLAGGTYNIPGDYPSLTNAGGIFAALDAAGATGNVTINITADLTGETGAVALNQLAGGFTVTIKPSGAARTISGTSVGANGGLVILNGADNVTIDGSLSGGTDRSLTINNASTGGADIWIRSADATNGATGNTVKNCILTGPAANAIAGVLSGGNAFGTAADAPNSNNTVQNILATRVQNALFLFGNAATFDQNWLITGNTFGSTIAADKLTFRGMLLGNANNFTITQNVIMGVVTPTTVTSTASGIQLAAVATNGTITRNNISDIKNTNTSGFGANGIFLAQTSTTANDLVANNFIRDVAGFGFAGVDQADNGYGIVVASGGGYNIYFNSVNLATSQTATGSITGAVNILAAVTTAGAVDLRDNILVNAETVGTRYGVINSSTQAAAVFTVINYNDYFAQNVGLQTSARTTLANWQTATGQDANSKAVDPLFVSAADLHLQSGSPMINMGAQTPIAPRESFNAPTAVTIDFDGQPRDATPDIGGDEFLGATAAGVNVGGRVVTSAGRGIAGARVYLTDSQGNVTMRQTNGLGYYRFIDVEAGGNYILTAEHKSYKFPPAQLYFISGESLDINFTAGGTSGKAAGQEVDKQK